LLGSLNFWAKKDTEASILAELALRRFPDYRHCWYQNRLCVIWGWCHMECQAHSIILMLPLSLWCLMLTVLRWVASQLHHWEIIFFFNVKVEWGSAVFCQCVSWCCILLKELTVI